MKLITPKDAAARLCVTEKTLANWRCTQIVNLPFYKLSPGRGGTIRYDDRGLDKYLESVKQGGKA